MEEKKITFEQALGRLEEIVALLEKGTRRLTSRWSSMKRARRSCGAATRRSNRQSAA